MSTTRPKLAITGYYVEDPNGDVRDTLFVTDRREAYAQARRLAAVIGKTVPVRVCREARAAVSEAPEAPQEARIYEVTVPVVVEVTIDDEGGMYVSEEPVISIGYPGFFSEADEAQGVFNVDTDEWGGPFSDDIAETAWAAVRNYLDPEAEAARVLASWQAERGFIAIDEAEFLPTPAEDLTGSMVAEVQDALTIEEQASSPMKQDREAAAVKRAVRALPSSTRIDQVLNMRDAAHWVFDMTVGQMPGTDITVPGQQQEYQHSFDTGHVHFGYIVSVGGVELSVGVTRANVAGPYVASVDLVVEEEPYDGQWEEDPSRFTSDLTGIQETLPRR